MYILLDSKYQVKLVTSLFFQVLHFCSRLWCFETNMADRSEIPGSGWLQRTASFQLGPTWTPVQHFPWDIWKWHQQQNHVGDRPTTQRHTIFRSRLTKVDDWRCRQNIRSAIILWWLKMLSIFYLPSCWEINRTFSILLSLLYCFEKLMDVVKSMQL